MKLSAWARQQGVSYKTAWRLWKAGKLPVPAEQLKTGTVILHAAPANEPPGVTLYASVSSGEQKADLDRQLSRLAEFSTSFRVVEAVRETGSGLHGRKALLRIYRNRNVQIIVVEHRDRLMRFGFAYVEAALAAQGRRVVVIDALGDNVRQDWLHQTTTRLVREFSVMGIEDLNVRGLLATEKLARKIGDIGFPEFRRQLEYKARLYGTDLVTASRWFPSSKICSACGRISEELPLSIREWTCECGTFHDRDINAARNLRRLCSR
jgi:putative resolvase